MWKLVEKLRALPEGSRKAVVLFSSAGITAVILLSWLVFPVPHFGSLSEVEKERKSAEQLSTPFSVIGGEIHGSLGGIKEKWSSFGGMAGILSAVSLLKENMMGANATSTATSTIASGPVPLDDEGLAASSTEEAATTTAEKEITATAVSTTASTTGDTF